MLDDDPGHVFPLRHRRVRVRIPPVQVALHELQLPQDVQTGAVEGMQNRHISEQRTEMSYVYRTIYCHAT